MQRAVSGAVHTIHIGTSPDAGRKKENNSKYTHKINAKYSLCHDVKSQLLRLFSVIIEQPRYLQSKIILMLNFEYNMTTDYNCQNILQSNRYTA